MTCTNSATFASTAVASSLYCLEAARLKAHELVLTCFVATLCTTSAAGAQERTVLRGTLVDSLSRPVAEATIRSSSPALTTFTDSEGRFGLSLERRDRLSLIISKVGFNPDTVHVSFAGRVLVARCCKRSIPSQASGRLSSTVASVHASPDVRRERSR